MCQIRAVKIALIAQSVLETVPTIEQRLEDLKSKVTVLSETIKQNPRGSFKDLYQKEQLELALTVNETFLTQCYLLTLTKKTLPPKPGAPFLANEKTDFHLLQTELEKDVSNKFTQALIRKLRKDVSSDSVKFIRSCAQSLLRRDQLLSFINQSLEAIHENSCQSLPFFFVNDILTQQLALSKISIFVRLKLINDNQIKVGKSNFLFTYKAEGYQRKLIPSEEELALPAFVLHANMQRPFRDDQDKSAAIEEFLRNSIIELILMNSAAHPQSLDHSKEEQIQALDPKRLNFYKAAASERGCSQENPSLFFINHAFCEKIKHAKINIHDRNLFIKFNLYMSKKIYLPLKFLNNYLIYVLY